uniref:Nif11 domain-containing protein n=1 Tax=Ascaris lumbricoides TaxID=6252 RepID=A0A0M3I3P9_ASCLU
MANEGGALTISEQLKLAKDMGYTDEEIMQAVNLNCARDGVCHFSIFFEIFFVHFFLAELFSEVILLYSGKYLRWP